MDFLFTLQQTSRRLEAPVIHHQTLLRGLQFCETPSPSLNLRRDSSLADSPLPPLTHTKEREARTLANTGKLLALNLSK